MRWRIVLVVISFAGAAQAKNLGMSEEELRAAQAYGQSSSSSSSTSPATTPDDAKAEQPTPTTKSNEVYRSMFRLGAGPAMFLAHADFGMGVGVTMDVGTGTVGFRVASTWFRAEKQGTPSEAMSPFGAGFGQYTGEITVDLRKRGPFHPVFAIGFGMIDVFRQGEVLAGVATGRIALEYALALDGADIRFGLGVTGNLLGPAPRELIPIGGYGIANAMITIGF